MRAACVITSCECDFFASHPAAPAAQMRFRLLLSVQFGLHAVFGLAGGGCGGRVNYKTPRSLRAAQVARAARRGKIAHLLCARTPNLHIMWHTHINSPAHPSGESGCSFFPAVLYRTTNTFLDVEAAAVGNVCFLTA